MQLEQMAKPLKDYVADLPDAGIPDVKSFQKELIRREKVERGKDLEERVNLSEFHQLIDDVIDKLNGG